MAGEVMKPRTRVTPAPGGEPIEIRDNETNWNYRLEHMTPLPDSASVKAHLYASDEDGPVTPEPVEVLVPRETIRLDKPFEFFLAEYRGDQIVRGEPISIGRVVAGNLCVHEQRVTAWK